MRKYYFVDPGLKNAGTDFIYEDIGQTLENVVFNELIYRGYTGSVGGYEKVSKEPSGKSVKILLKSIFSPRKEFDNTIFKFVTTFPPLPLTRGRLNLIYLWWMKFKKSLS